MGSGCNGCYSYNANSCTEIVSSDCIKWQGNAYSTLEICINDTLSEVGNIILDKIVDLLAGRGILLPDLTISDCEYIEDLLDDEEKNLLNILDVFKQALCQLRAELTTLQNIVNDFTDVLLYDLGCLAPLVDPCGDDPTFRTLIQAIITKLCELSVQLDSVADSILPVVEDVTGNFIQTAIRSCGNNGISYTGSGSSSLVTIQALVPPNSPIIYLGTTTYFDGNGVGLSNTPMCGWYLCNGNNGTPNSTALPQNLAGTLKYIIRFT